MVLVLSSEWEYSPLVYRDIPALPGFVLIGFPATESGNSLLAPLTGHELGHSLWSLRKCHLTVKDPIYDTLVSAMMDRSRDFKEVFGQSNITPDNLTTDMFLVRIWQPAQMWALSQAEEMFCDFVALKIFGRAYLYSFSYLLSPSHSMPRSVRYPALKTRAENLVHGAKKYGVEVPKGFDTWFEKDSPPSLECVDTFRLAVADESLQGVLDLLARLADQVVADSEDPETSQSEVDRILEKFHMAVPAAGCKKFADILNAAWMAFEDDQLWSSSSTLQGNRHEILNELVLKTVEIFEIEQRMK